MTILVIPLNVLSISSLLWKLLIHLYSTNIHQAPIMCEPIFSAVELEHEKDTQGLGFYEVYYTVG